MLNMQQHNILEGILDSTFGRPSMQNLNKTSHALRHKIGTASDGKTILEIRYERGVNFNPLVGLDNQKKALDKDSFEAIGKKISETKKIFREDAETSINIKSISDPQSEITVISMNRDLVRARYRATLIYEISA
jgi:hypothetical protein